MKKNLLRPVTQEWDGGEKLNSECLSTSVFILSLEETNGLAHLRIFRKTNTKSLPTILNGDKILGITMLDVEFENPPEYHPFSKYPQLNGGKM